MKFTEWINNREVYLEAIDQDFFNQVKQKIERAANQGYRQSMISSTHQSMARIAKALNSYRPNTTEGNIVDKFLNLLRDNKIEIPNVPDQGTSWEAVKTLWNRAATSPQIPQRVVKNASARIPNPAARQVPEEPKSKFEYPMGSQRIRSLIVDAVKKTVNKEPPNAILTMAAMKPINSDKDLSDSIVGVLRQMGFADATVDKLPPEYRIAPAAVTQSPTQNYSSDLNGASSGFVQIDPKQNNIDRNSQSVLNVRSLSEVKPEMAGNSIYRYLYVINNGKFYNNPYYQNK